MNNEIFFSLYGLAHRSTFLDWLFVFVSNNFGYIMIFLAFLFLFLHTDGVFDYRLPFLQLKNKIKEILLVFSSALFAWILQAILKLFIISPRPFIFFENVKPLFFYKGMDSFPSGHAMFFGALAMSLYFIHKRIGFIYFIVALIIGLSRVISGIHFPIDILFGYIFGIIIALIFRLILIKKPTIF